MLNRRTLLTAIAALVALLAVPAAGLANPVDTISDADKAIVDSGGDAAANTLDSPTLDQYNSTNVDLPVTVDKPGNVTGGGGTLPDIAETPAAPTADGGGAAPTEKLDSTPARTVAAGGGLPFTGLPLAVVFGLGMSLSALGLLMIMRGRKSDGQA